MNRPPRFRRPPARMTATRETDPDAVADDTGGSGAADGPLSWLTDGPTETRRTTTRSFRLSPSECDRIDSAASGAGMTTSAYLRSRVLGPGPDVAAWRRVYELLRELEAEASESPVDAERVRQLKASFEEVALGLFSEEEAGR